MKVIYSLLIIVLLPSMVLATPISGQDNLVPQHNGNGFECGQEVFDHIEPPLFVKRPWWEWHRSTKEIFKKVWEWVW